MSTTSFSESPAPRTLQACENCRIRKSRCLPSDQPGVCIRCRKSKISCVFASKTKAKVPPGPRVLRELQPATAEEPDILPSLFTSQNIPEEMSFESLHRDMLENLFPQVLIPPNPVSDSKSQQPPQITNARMTAKQTQECIERYQSINMFSPFVQLPRNWIVEDMLKNHPVLTLAILTAMSFGQSQMGLEYRFRQLLSERVIVQRQHNLDTLQGLLVFLAWCPLYVNPRRGGLFQTVQMVGTLVRDLRLDINAPTMDQKRAFVGACYLCSVLSNPPRRPNNLPFSESARSALLAIASHPESDMDKLLVSMVTIQLIIEDSRAVYSLDDTLLQSWLCQIQMMGCLGHTMNGYLEMMRKFAIMKIYLTALPHLLPQQPSLGDQCVAAVRDLFEAYVAMDKTAYMQLPTAEFSRLILVIIALFTLFSTLPVGNTELSQFGHYLDALHERMNELSNLTAGKYSLAKTAFGVVKEKYARLVEEGTIVNLASMCPIVNTDLQHQADLIGTDMFAWSSDFASSEDGRTESSG